MTSLLRSFKQVSVDSGYFVALADISNAVFTPISTLGLTVDSTGSLVAWTVPASFTRAPGDMFKDMGRTVRALDPDGYALTFRKVRYVDPTSPETNGITGSAPGDGSDFNVGYILLGIEGAVGTTVPNAVVAKVAKYGL